MKNRIIKHFLASLAMYLIISFVKWNLLWITNIPNYHSSLRACMILVFLMYHVLIYVSINIHELSKRN